MIKIFDRLCFFGPMGLGDNFVVSGIVHYFADRCNEIHVPIQPKFIKTMTTLYKDHENIIVFPLADEEELEQYVNDNKLSKLLRIPLAQSTIRNYQIIPMWDIQLYSNYELSFGLRYSNFRLPECIEGAESLYNILGNNEPYILVHRFTGDDPNGIPIDIPGFRANEGLVDNIRVVEIREGLTNDMMQYVDLIKNASEIHCVPSSFHCLVDSIDTKAKLYFHDIREKTSMAVNTQWNNFKWTEVHYEQRL